MRHRINHGRKTSVQFGDDENLSIPISVFNCHHTENPTRTVLILSDASPETPSYYFRHHFSCCDVILIKSPQKTTRGVTLRVEEKKTIKNNLIGNADANSTGQCCVCQLLFVHFEEHLIGTSSNLFITKTFAQTSKKRRILRNMNQLTS